jgi:hypothetical protein
MSAHTSEVEITLSATEFDSLKLFIATDVGKYTTFIKVSCRDVFSFNVDN